MKKEFGKWLMDISKYIITAVILSSFFKDAQEDNIVYIGGGLIAVITVVCGLYLQKEPILQKKRRK